MGHWATTGKPYELDMGWDRIIIGDMTGCERMICELEIAMVARIKNPNRITHIVREQTNIISKR